MFSPEEQLHTLKSGAAGIAPADALIGKLKQGRPLVAKLGVDPTDRKSVV